MRLLNGVQKQMAFYCGKWERSTNGTDVILHLKSDEKEFLEPWRIKEIVKNIQIIYLTLLY